MWTNTKAMQAGAGKEGTIYPTFEEFTSSELRQHVGLYIFHGLAPSPKVSDKFRRQADDPVHGRDFIRNYFGVNAGTRHRMFKAFFSVQDPSIKLPPRDKWPNWKVRPLIKWMNFVFPLVWSIGVSFSIDEMTMRFKGKHKDKRRITYKAEGDGFQADALCDAGFTYQVFMRNDPAPKKYTRLGLSPLHSRVMALFDSVEDIHHECWMDNLYNSAAFCKKAFQHPKKVLVSGVTRRGMRGIPKCVQQEVVESKKGQREVRGTVKAAVLRGDDDCPSLVAASGYDAKPVHFLSMSCTSLHWRINKKSVYNVDTGESEPLEFLRLNTIHDYNQKMGGVDIADQLRGTYRLDRWVRNRKWWWSIMYWSFGVMLTNAYVVYLDVNEQKGIKKSKLLSHHNFLKEIALAWIRKDVVGKKRKAECITSTTSTTSVSVLTGDSAFSAISAEEYVHKKGKRLKRINDSSLDPHNGYYKCRLSLQHDHLPEIPKGRHRCLLHRWAGKDCRAQIMYCPTCNVTLCVQCYKPFHTKTDLIRCKIAISNS